MLDSHIMSFFSETVKEANAAWGAGAGALSGAALGSVYDAENPESEGTGRALGIVGGAGLGAVAGGFAELEDQKSALKFKKQRLEGELRRSKRELQSITQRNRTLARENRISRFRARQNLRRMLRSNRIRFR